jgi:hypothetical protein
LKEVSFGKNDGNKAENEEKLINGINEPKRLKQEKARKEKRRLRDRPNRVIKR